MNEIRMGQYLAIPCKDHARSIEGYVYKHVIVAEKKLGRPLKLLETVHHIDENKDNNSPENLIVFKSHNDHMRFHKTGKIEQEKDYYISPLYKKVCPECKKEFEAIRQNQKMCSVICAQNHLRTTDRPSRDVLKDDIRNSNFTAIGKKYGVSDNAIRKWCKAYNLPFRVFDIKQINNEDWKNL